MAREDTTLDVGTGASSGGGGGGGGITYTYDPPSGLYYGSDGRWYYDSGGFGDSADFIPSNPPSSGGGGGGGSSGPSYQYEQDETGQWWRLDPATGEWTKVAGGPGAATGNKIGDQRTNIATGNVEEWDGTRWVDTGKKEPTPGLVPGQQRVNIATGNVEEWDTSLNGGAGGWRDTGMKPQQEPKDPVVREFPDGSLRQYDPVAGTWVTIADAPPKDTTAMDIARMQIAANQAQAEARMAFDAAENAAQRAFQAEQARLDREQNLAIENARGQREHERTQLEAAKAFSEAVNSVDPTAMPAFLAAGGGSLGGGSLANADATGANAITDNALLPAARLLGIARSEYQPITMGGGSGGGGLGGGAGAGGLGGLFGGLSGNLGGGGEEAATGGLFATPNYTLNTNNGAAYPTNSSQEVVDARRRWEEMQAQRAAGGLRMATGGYTTAPLIMTGDSTAADPFAGGAKPEMIANPMRAPLGVANSAETAGGLGKGFFSLVPRFPFGTGAFGGLFSGLFGQRDIPYGDDQKTNQVTQPTQPTQPTTPGANAGGLDENGNPIITDEDRANMEKVRALRQGVKLPLDRNAGYTLDWWNQLPTMRKAQLMAMQAKTGISAEDWAADYEKNRLGGTDRAGLGIRY